MTVYYSEQATDDLIGIFDYTANTHGIEQAIRYEDFLRENIDALAINPDVGTELEIRAGYFRLTLKWPKSKHGHVVIYAVDDDAQSIDILNLYHSSMDIEGRLEEEHGGDDND